MFLKVLIWLSLSLLDSYLEKIKFLRGNSDESMVKIALLVSACLTFLFLSLLLFLLLFLFSGTSFPVWFFVSTLLLVIALIIRDVARVSQRNLIYHWRSDDKKFTSSGNWLEL
ncbi:MAG: hypothetical protein V5A57_01235 [Candidatus Paceibacterota bacterium]